MPINRTCSVPGCSHPHDARGLCGTHYSAMRRGGMLAPLPPPQRWKIDPDSQCWNWTQVLSDTGYGVFRFNGRSVLAHRWSYEQHRASIPQGMQIDHLCRNRACVNPDHLEAVTPWENNVARSTSQAALHYRQTHCLRGHEFTADNTYIPPNRPVRQCRECSRLRDKRRREQRIRTGRR